MKPNIPTPNKESYRNNNVKTIGFVRKSNNGHALKIDICMNELDGCTPYTSKDGKKYTTVFLHLDSAKEIIAETRIVARIVSYTENGK